MATLSGLSELACNGCGKHFFIHAEDLEVEQTGSDERNMGPEIFYAGEVELYCFSCQNEIRVSYEASEYPVGIPNYHETNAEGAQIISGFGDIDIYYDEEIYSFEEESRLYLPEEKKIITNLTSSAFHLYEKARTKPEILYGVDPREFEELIAHIFSKYGFKVELTKRSRDGERDIIAIQSILGIESKFIIECKRYSKENPVSVELVRSLHGVQMAEGANKSILATTSRFTPDAIKFASQQNTTEWAMSLKDFDDIKAWLK